MITRRNIIIGTLVFFAIMIAVVVFLIWQNTQSALPSGTSNTGGLPPPAPGATMPPHAATSAFSTEMPSNLPGGISGPSNGSKSSGGTHGTVSGSGNTSGKVAVTAKTSSGATKTYHIIPTASDQNGDYLFSKSDFYDLVYFPDGTFLIALKDPNLNLARQRAEAAFLSALGITKTTACTLTVNLRVPYGVNANASGIDYGLSFCPNGKPFPQ